ncbi:MAG: type I phosphomannose isomerase catalytic subunit, partial [Ilumatobacteraceae bacterium]
MPQFLDGVVQHYDWGNSHTIPELLGLKSDSRPWAELWFGTHPGGPSNVTIDGQARDLTSLSGDLSFLVKIIAAARPLSLQTHPTLDQALDGFERENKHGIPHSDPSRIYRDASA